MDKELQEWLLDPRFHRVLLAVVGAVAALREYHAHDGIPPPMPTERAHATHE
jgi:hypothetical protein